MKNNISRFILLFSDLCVIGLSIVLAFYTREGLNNYFNTPLDDFLLYYLLDFKFYAPVLGIFFYEGLYLKRFDFWHETRKILKGIIFALLILLSFFALSKTMQEYSRFTIIIAFVYMAILIPSFKYILKKSLYNIGIWKREAKVYGDDPFLKSEIFNNHYLGYVETKNENAKTVFINAESFSSQQLKNSIDKQMETKEEVIFIPFLNDYNLAQTYIYQLTNTRTNLIVLQNKLKSKVRTLTQTVVNYIFAVLLLPILIPIIGILAFLIKKESTGPVFFAHNRIGKDGKIIPTYKFRSMYSDAKERLEKLLEESEEIREEWETNFKLKDDPRVTKIGAFLRKTSLDELPQIFNVLKGEMNFVGPRPVIQKELDLYYKEDATYYLMVKPGITGLWQVSGRSDTDYDFRISMDKWYVKNWSLWLDFIILVKTVKVVLFRDGAY